MKAAIYYPYLQVQTHGLMKHALLFWDQLEVITPFDKIDLPNDKELAVASELLVKPCNPSDTQKEQAHIQLMDLVSRPLPAWFYIGSEQPKDWIYADKFFRKTWDELQKRGLALAQSDNEKHYWSSKALGMLMMSVLADC